MGRLLDDVQASGDALHEAESRLDACRGDLLEKIRAAHAEGIRPADIGRAAGISRQGVSYYLRKEPNGQT